jgi:GTP-binding protein Era
VHNLQAGQIIFVDTPGLHRNATKAMNRLMNRTAAAALADADVVLFMTEALIWNDEDEDVLRRLEACQSPVVALLNKVDRVQPKEQLFQALTAMDQRYAFAEIIPISALKRDNLEALLDTIEKYLPESPRLFPADMQSDRGAEFRAAEIIREKLTMRLREEVPYGLTVQIERYETSEQRVMINAIIWVERSSQKGIVVGKGGRMLKKVGRAARVELSEQLGRPVRIELWVKVRDNWADREQDLLRLGYESP